MQIPNKKWSSLPRTGVTNVVHIDDSPLSRDIKEDRIRNQDMIKRLEEYWAKMGHEVKYELIFDPKLSVHSIITKDLKNGLPCNEKLTSIAKKNLVHLNPK